MKRILLTTALIALSTVHLFADPDEDLLTSKEVSYKDRFGNMVTEHHEIKTAPKVTIVPDGTYQERWQTRDWDNAGACNHVITHRAYHLKGETKIHEVTEEGTMRTNGDNVSLKQLATAAAKVEQPLTQRAYDDKATIRMYLRDSGYNDLSDAQIDQISAYMQANGIHHVSELSQ